MDAKNFQPASTAPPNGENSNQVTQFEKPPPSYDQVIMNQNNKTNQRQVGLFCSLPYFTLMYYLVSLVA